MNSGRKPTFVRSPVSLRPRSDPRAPLAPSDCLSKTLIPTPDRSWNVGESAALRPEFRSLSGNLRALSRMVQGEFGGSGNAASANSGPDIIFERGRFYEEYSARRNERLRRKRCEAGGERRAAPGLGVTVESGKRRGDSRKLVEHSLKRSMQGSLSKGRRREEIPIPRYSLRSNSRKENAKPPLAAMRV